MKNIILYFIILSSFLLSFELSFSPEYRLSSGFDEVIYRTESWDNDHPDWQPTKYSNLPNNISSFMLKFGVNNKFKFYFSDNLDIITELNFSFDPNWNSSGAQLYVGDIHIYFLKPLNNNSSLGLGLNLELGEIEYRPDEQYIEHEWWWDEEHNEYWNNYQWISTSSLNLKIVYNKIFIDREKYSSSIKFYAQLGYPFADYEGLSFPMMSFGIATNFKFKLNDIFKAKTSIL